MKYWILSLTLLASLPAVAATNMAEIFSDVDLDSPVCFIREYSRAHLRSKPSQTVERIKIKLKLMKYPEADEATSLLAIQVKRKNETGVWTNNIACFDDEENKTVRCSVECDGGSVEVLSRTASGKMILQNNGVILHGGCGEEEKTMFLESVPGGDDVFHLQRADARFCADVTDEAH